MQWLALHLPALPLEVFDRALAAPLPLAVSEGGRLIACNRPAWEQGVRSGLTDGAARALSAGLRILPRQPAREQAALLRIAAWALHFSDQVSLESPHALVLEAGRSLRLFGGAKVLHRQVIEGVAALGYRARCCLAPTPAGALTLAAWGGNDLILDQDALRQALSSLPPAVLSLERQSLDDLTRMGLTRIGDLLRLPRAGLAERFGIERLHQIERLLGERPDPRLAFKPPARYLGELELPAEVPDAPSLLFACRRLIDELGGFLLGRQAGVQRLHWRLGHADLPPTCFDLGSASPERDPEHWRWLLRERLERLALPAPVRDIRLASEPIRPLPRTSLALFPEATPPAPCDPGLLDRLRARLGDDAVRGLALVADHRPERAWRWTRPVAPNPHPPDAQGQGMPRGDRPLWLLASPRPMASHGRQPWYDGPLDLGQGRERIETGWWDGMEVARDYFVATTRCGERLWIYRELRGQRCWFLHGLFGSSTDTGP